ncbi:hypothetical protein CMO92_00930 [Candidatus Woesearchaeota archaeon]|nr:hypothetical protein [Candidatus Woesearchaeota archaeon]
MKLISLLFSTWGWPQGSTSRNRFFGRYLAVVKIWPFFNRKCLKEGAVFKWMSFQDIPPVESGTHIIDVAFKKGKLAASHQAQKNKTKDLLAVKRKELARFEAVAGSLQEQLSKIVRSFPAFDGLTEFYEELFGCFLDISQLRKDLSAISWAAQKTREFQREYGQKVRGAERERIEKVRGAFLGRMASLVKRLEKKLLGLEDARKVMRGFPQLKEGLFTIAIAGFPNVGKSTLLGKLTPARPEVGSYAFTTKRLNVGYLQIGARRLQFVDTPGSLNRFDRLNVIEKQAVLVLKYRADAIVFVLDLSEPYPLKDQMKLLKEMDEYGVPVWVYLSKRDILPEKDVKGFVKRSGLKVLKYEDLVDILAKKAKF